VINTICILLTSQKSFVTITKWRLQNLFCDCHKTNFYSVPDGLHARFCHVIVVVNLLRNLFYNSPKRIISNWTNKVWNIGYTLTVYTCAKQRTNTRRRRRWTSTSVINSRRRTSLVDHTQRSALCTVAGCSLGILLDNSQQSILFFLNF